MDGSSKLGVDLMLDGAGASLGEGEGAVVSVDTRAGTGAISVFCIDVDTGIEEG